MDLELIGESSITTSLHKKASSFFCKQRFQHIMGIQVENYAMFQVIFGGYFLFRVLQFTNRQADEDETRPVFFFHHWQCVEFFVRLKRGSSFNVVEFSG